MRTADLCVYAGSGGVLVAGSHWAMPPPPPRSSFFRLSLRATFPLSSSHRVPPPARAARPFRGSLCLGSCPRHDLHTQASSWICRRAVETTQGLSRIFFEGFFVCVRRVSSQELSFADFQGGSLYMKQVLFSSWFGTASRRCTIGRAHAFCPIPSHNLPPSAFPTSEKRPVCSDPRFPFFSFTPDFVLLSYFYRAQLIYIGFFTCIETFTVWGVPLSFARPVRSVWHFFLPDPQLLFLCILEGPCPAAVRTGVFSIPPYTPRYTP